MSFFKTFFASLLAIFVSVFFLFLLGVILFVSSQKETEPYIGDGSVLEINMGSTLIERPSPDPLSMLMQDPDRVPITLRELESNLEKAAADQRIEGVWIKVNNLAAPWAHLAAMRNEMLKFRETSGKFIYVSTEDIGFNEQSFFIATAADSVFSPPETFFEFDGFFIQAVFFKEFLDKIGVEAEIFRAGDYKSAVEPFYRSSFSEENELQLQAIIDNVADIFLDAVGRRTGKSRAELDALMNEEPVLTSRGAFEAGLIDKLLYPSEVKKQIETRIKEQGHRELRTVSYNRYNRVSRSAAGIPKAAGNDKIALIYASGNIMPDPGAPSVFPDSREMITARGMADHLKAAREDDQVKAIVLRINSPGGAGSTSDLIWHEIRQTAMEKPVIASMGSVAASGGYYIGMAADTIVASGQSITGSIGVFGVAMNMQELFNEKLGLYFDEVTTHEQSLWLTPDKPMTEVARTTFQSYVDEFYNVFLQRVSESRNMTIEEVHEVAGGRVWAGTDAYEAGLVDVLGELNEALAIAAEAAGIEAYTVESYPKPKSLLELLSGSAQKQVKILLNPGIKELEHLDPIFHILKNDSRTVIARIPFDYQIH
ncbi:MAG: signal peptide peptidase SppA [Balneolales bacterium]